MSFDEDARADVVVRAGDQRDICEFGRLNTRKVELVEEMAAADKRVSELEDAEEAVLLADDAEPGAFKLQVGECFIDSDAEAAGAFVSSALDADKAARERGAAELARVTARLGELKASLYARFGKSINLEDGAPPGK